MRHIRLIGEIELTRTDWENLDQDEVMDLVVQRYDRYNDGVTVIIVDLVAKSKTEYARYGWTQEGA